MALVLVLLAAASHALQAPRRVARHTTLRMATEIVQFTTDLRVADHGGLRAAANADAWLPVYCGEDADDARVAIALRELDAELKEKYDAPLRIVRGPRMRSVMLRRAWTRAPSTSAPTTPHSRRRTWKRPWALRSGPGRRRCGI